MMKISHLLAISVLGAVITGCSVLPDPAPANTIYRLSEMPAPVTANDDAFVVRVDRPQASIVFQTRDIVVSPDGQRLSTAAQAKWAEVMPVLIQQAFIDVLESRPNLVGVMPASGARTDTRLQITVKNFEAQFDRGPDAAPLAVVDFTVTYAKASNRNYLGTHSVRKTHRAEAASVSAIVNAISKANKAALSDITDWLEKQPNHQTSAS